MENFKWWIGFILISCILNCANQSKRIHQGLTPAPKVPNATSEVIQVGCTNALTLLQGQVLTLKLPAVAGTGYLWRLSAPNATLKQQHSDTLNYEKIESKEINKVGYKQYQILSLEAITIGTIALNCEYVRPFEPEKVIEQCSIAVTIHPK